MNTYHSWDQDCASNSGMVKVLTKPEHGTLTPRIVDWRISRLRRSQQQSPCAGTPIKAFEVSYRSDDGFVGVDTFTLDIMFGGGRHDTDFYTVTVISPNNAPERTCTSAYQDCARVAPEEALCAAARNKCMQTGRWIGPMSKRDFGPALKK
jgi:hypothetical protein